MTSRSSTIPYRKTRSENKRSVISSIAFGGESVQTDPESLRDDKSETQQKKGRRRTMKNRTFKQVLFMAVAFVVALFSSIASATPETGKFQVVHRSGEDANKDPRPHVVVGPRVQVDQIVRAFSVMYKNATGKELTWQMIQAENVKNTIPVCKIPGDGPMWRGRGDTSVWENCPEEHRTVALIAGSSGVIRIPMRGVETYGQKMDRLNKQEQCLSNPACLTERLKVLGVQAPHSNDGASTPSNNTSPDGVHQSPASVPTAMPSSIREEPLQMKSSDVDQKDTLMISPRSAFFGMLVCLLGLAISFKSGKKTGYSRGTHQGILKGFRDGSEEGFRKGREDVLEVVGKLPSLNITIISGPIEWDSLSPLQKEILRILSPKGGASSRLLKSSRVTPKGAKKSADLEAQVLELKAQQDASNRSADKLAENFRVKLREAKEAQKRAEEAQATLRSEFDTYKMESEFAEREREAELEKLKSRPSVVVYGQPELSSLVDDEDTFDGAQTVVRDAEGDNPIVLRAQIEERDTQIADLQGELSKMRDEVQKSTDQAGACTRAFHATSDELEVAKNVAKELRDQLKGASQEPVPIDFEGALRLAERLLRRGVRDTQNPLALSQQAYTYLLSIMTQKIKPDEDLVASIPDKTARSLMTTEDHYLPQLIEALVGYGAQIIRETRSFRPSEA